MVVLYVYALLHCIVFEVDLLFKTSIPVLSDCKGTFDNSFYWSTYTVGTLYFLCVNHYFICATKPADLVSTDMHSPGCCAGCKTWLLRLFYHGFLVDLLKVQVGQMFFCAGESFSILPCKAGSLTSLYCKWFNLTNQFQSWCLSGNLSSSYSISLPWFRS